MSRDTSHVVPERDAERTPADVVWHDLECGAYRVDVPLWLALAGQAEGPILDVGAGTGRVSLELAGAGHDVTAIDRDATLLAALRARASAAGLTVETVCADARSFALARRDFALCVMPMQTIQLLDGADGRIEFLRRARVHLRPGAVVACAILGALEPFDCSTAVLGPTAERASVDGLCYVSRAVRVAQTRSHVVIERDRRISPAAAGGEHERSATAAPAVERDVIELDRVSARALTREARAAGLRAEPPLEIAATDEHVGSTVVVLRV